MSNQNYSDFIPSLKNAKSSVWDLYKPQANSFASQIINIQVGKFNLS